MNDRPIRLVRGPLDVTLRAVPSKSVTHRALLAAALARGRSSIENPLEAEDTHVTREGIEALGARVLRLPGRWEVEAVEAGLAGGVRIRLGASGTSARFLLALAALGEKPSELDGDARLRERPLDELAQALRSCGARIELARGGGLPARAGGSPVHGGAVSLPSGRSSQFASALLLIGSRLPQGLELELRPPIVSYPYVELTASVLEAFGVRIERPAPDCLRVRPTVYAGRRYRVEGDHSSASYPLAAAAILGGRVRVTDLDPASRQPDARLSEILAGLGCDVERGPDWIEVRGGGAYGGFDLQLADAPDLVPTLAVLGLFAEGPSVLRGVAHLRLKESDRLEVLAHNLRRLGRPAVAGPERLEIGPAAGPLRGTRVQTAADHRMAMAFAVAGLRLAGLSLDDAGCVAKSNPGFWEQFALLEKP